jgi:hypothetical protein
MRYIPLDNLMLFTKKIFFLLIMEYQMHVGLKIGKGQVDDFVVIAVIDSAG